jgi:hypothetical protein
VLGGGGLRVGHQHGDRVGPEQGQRLGQRGGRRVGVLLDGLGERRRGHVGQPGGLQQVSGHRFGDRDPGAGVRGGDRLGLGDQLVDLRRELLGVGRVGGGVVRVEGAEVGGEPGGQLLHGGQAVPDVLVERAVLVPVLLGALFRALFRALLVPVRLLAFRVPVAVLGLGGGLGRFGGPGGGLQPGQLDDVDHGRVRAGGVDERRDEGVVAAPVEHDQLGAGHRGGVGGGALVGVRVGGRVVDQRGDGDQVAAHRAGDGAVDVGRGDDDRLRVIGRRRGRSGGRPRRTRSG